MSLYGGSGQKEVEDIIDKMPSGYTKASLGTAVLKYREYSRFKSSKFNCVDRTYDEGQITGLSFKLRE